MSLWIGSSDFFLLIFVGECAQDYPPTNAKSSKIYTIKSPRHFWGQARKDLTPLPFILIDIISFSQIIFGALTRHKLRGSFIGLFSQRGAVSYWCP